MLHVRVDVVPGGEENGRFTISEVFVANDGTGNRYMGNYDVYVQDPRGKPYPRENRDGYIGRIENFHRPAGRVALAAAALDLLREKGTEAAHHTGEQR